MAEYIERESLINHLNQSAAKHYSRAVERVIELEPAADVAPVRRGHWVRVGSGTTCSECMTGLRRTTALNAEWVDLSEMSYCPNCGAEMKRVKK